MNGVLYLSMKKTPIEQLIYDYEQWKSKHMKPIELDPSRQNLKPRPKGLTDQEYFMVALKEGHALIAVDEKNPSVTPASAKTISKLQNALAKLSDNPYVRARAQLLEKMRPTLRADIEKMEAGALPKDDRFNTFCRSVTELGDKLSWLNWI